MHSIRTISAILILIFLTSSMSGCYDARELDDYSFVNVIGVDKGVTDKLRFTILFPTLKNDTGSMGNTSGMSKSVSSTGHSIISIDCPTLYSGINMINTSLSRTINYSHAKFLVISEEMARKGVESFIDGMMRTRQIRRGMYVMVAKGKASEYIEEFSPPVGTALSRTQEDIMDKEGETGIFDMTTYFDLLNNMKSFYGMPTVALTALNDFSHYKTEDSEPTGFKDIGDYYPGEMPRKGGNKAEFIGLAVFDGDKMVGELNGDETRAKLMITDEYKRGAVVIPDPKDKNVRLTVDVRMQRKAKIKVEFENEVPVIDVKLFLEGEEVSIQSPNNYESGELKQLLEEKYSEYIKGTLDETIDKCRNLGTDIFRFGERAAMHFSNIRDFEAYNWNSHFKDAKVNTKVVFVVRRAGTIFKTNPTITTEGEKE